MEPTPDKSKIRSLHGLRGVMAWWVVIGHVSLGLGWKLPLVDKNTLAVDVFILLSGFVIAILVERKAEPYWAYITRRACRLFPLYLPILAISTALLPIQLLAWKSLSSTPSNLNRIKLAQEATANLSLHASLHVPLLQGVVPKAFGDIAYSIVGQAWSVSLEWQFYVIAPFLIAAMIGRKWLVTGAIALVLLALAPFFSGAFLGAKIPLFGVGIATHLLLKPELRRDASIAAGIFTVAAIGTGGLLQFIPLGIWAAVIASSVRPAHSWGHLSAKFLASRVPFHMGEISYSIYLLHMIPFYLSIYACSLTKIGGVQADIVITLATMVVTYVAAVASYHVLEKPGIKFGSWLTRRRPELGT